MYWPCSLPPLEARDPPSLAGRSGRTCELTLPSARASATTERSSRCCVNIPRGEVHNFYNASSSLVRMILTFTPSGIEKFFEETLEPAYDLRQAPPDNLEAVVARYDEAAPRYGLKFVVEAPTSDLVEARFASQLLGDEPAADPVAVAARLLAVQAQDLRSARLAIRARTSGLAASDVDRCLADATLVVGWLNRGTLHLVRREDYWWLHALTTPPLFTANARRLAQTGVTPDAAERGVATIERALTEDGPLTRDDLRARVDDANVPTAGQALVHLLMLTCLRGIAVRGPLVDGRHAYVLARDWIGPPPRVERAATLAELARRYLIGHAPADERDLAKWAGLPLRDARAGLAAIAGEAEERNDTGRARACLLDQWDPVLVGWVSRGDLLEHYPRRDSPEAHYRPFAYVRGRAVATWGLRQGVVEIDAPFGPLRRTDERALAADAADVARFLAG